MVNLMPIVRQCMAPGCETLTIGPLCLEHETVPVRTFVRGRPLVKVPTEARRSASTSSALLASVRRASVREAAVPLRR
jgi:hypothetical protein